MAKQQFDRHLMVALWNRYNGNETRVAEKLEVTRAAVRKARKQMDPTLFIVDVENYRKKRADILAQINMRANQEILYRLMDPVLSKKMGTTELNKIGGTAHDKERLERGQATEHIAHAHYEALDDKQLKALKEFSKTMTNRKMGAIAYDNDENED